MSTAQQGCRIDQYTKDQLYFYKLAMNNQKRNLKNNSISNSMKKNKILSNELNRGGERFVL